MEDRRWFGLSAVTRHKIYRWIGVPILGFLIFGGEFRWIGIALFAVAMIWLLFFDPIGKDGERTFMGFSRKSARKWGISSVFGQKVDE